MWRRHANPAGSLFRRQIIDAGKRPASIMTPLAGSQVHA
jgi:hypothetical protein